MAIKFVDSTASGANDGTSWTDAYTSLNTAISAANHAPGDQYLVSGTFNEIVTIAEVAAATTPTYLQGDDKSGGAGVGNPATFTIDGQATRASCIANVVAAANYVFRNMRCTDATGACVNGGGLDNCVWIDCRFDNGGTWGFQADNNQVFNRCTFDNNVTGGVDTDAIALHIESISHTNGNGYGIQHTSGILYGCLIYNNGTGNGVIAQSGTNAPAVMLNSTLDGNSQGGVIGYDDNSSSIGTFAFVNNIFANWKTALDFAADFGHQVLVGNNVYYNNLTADVNGNADVGSGENPQTGDPVFTGATDFTIGAAGSAKATGTDAGDSTGGTSFMDIGAHQREEAGGGGVAPLVDGGLVH